MAGKHLLPEESMRDVNALALYLTEKGVAEDAVEILKNEGVTGETLPDLTESDLKELLVKVGPRKRIMQLINAVTPRSYVLHVSPDTPFQLPGCSDTMDNSVSVPVIESDTICSEFSSKDAKDNEDLHAATVVQGPAETVHPYLVCAVGENTSTFFIKADSRLLAVDCHPMKAFDTFKLHFVFRVHYAHQLTNFYNFISSCIYMLDTPRPCCDALNVALSNIEI